MVHRNRHPLFSSQPVTRQRAASWRNGRRWASLLVLAALHASCSRSPDTDATNLAPTSDTKLILDGRVENLPAGERLMGLYFPDLTQESTRELSLATDGRGRTKAQVTLPPAHCLHVLLERDDNDATDHPLALRVRTTSSPDEEGRTLAIAQAHATALPLSGICPSREQALPLELEIRGAANASYTLRLFLPQSDALERGVFAQGRRDLPGFQPYGPLQEDTLAANRRGSFPLALSPERCFAIVAYADEGLLDIDARLVRLSGELLALEVSTDQASVLGPYCPYELEVARVEFRAYEGEGRFRWQVWASPEATGRRLYEAREASPTGTLPTGLRRELQDAGWPQASAPTPSETR